MPSLSLLPLLIAAHVPFTAFPILNDLHALAALVVLSALAAFTLAALTARTALTLVNSHISVTLKNMLAYISDKCECLN
jgi:hypothetical protein